MKKPNMLVVLCRDEVAPRFDMSVEVLVAEPLPDGDTYPTNHRHLLLANPSAEAMCDLITNLGIGTVVCGGIEADHYHFLRWKRIDVICNVAGLGVVAMDAALAGTLQDGTDLFQNAPE